MSVESVAVSAPSVPPREIPEIVELVSPVLFSVPVTVGVSVSAPAVGTTVRPKVCPLYERVEVERVTEVAVVEAYPEPRAVR